MDLIKNRNAKATCVVLLICICAVCAGCLFGNKEHFSPGDESESTVGQDERTILRLSDENLAGLTGDEAKVQYNTLVESTIRDHVLLLEGIRDCSVAIKQNELVSDFVTVDSVVSTAVSVEVILSDGNDRLSENEVQEIVKQLRSNIVGISIENISICDNLMYYYQLDEYD